ncbi:Variant surface glycoprotein [Trypanosoma congolense IL3000]|uniref:Variant surface glycoprotein n=1 Tax=Trypanosoma congolense (strain IL3000) TaxID=1068625 RepID=F9W3K7_TRYCI|nr:Variant surface glycoprotein [Trypanosoma congolense IL3000]
MVYVLTYLFALSFYFRLGCWMVMMEHVIMICFMGVMVMRATHSETDHNEEAHKLLCSVLGAAVAKYNEVKDEESRELKIALGKTIFGNSGGSGRIHSNLPMPENYNTEGDGKSKNNRKYLCGACDGETHPGISATHDLVCLCTPGQMGWPISSTKQNEKLCGKNQSTWVDVGSVEKGWYTGWNIEEKDSGRDHIKKTWVGIVNECLKGGDASNLEKALKTFVTKVRGIGEDPLGKGKSDCDGKLGFAACVLYHPRCAKNRWWEELENSIQKDKEKAEREKSKAVEEGEKLKTYNEAQATPQIKARTPQPTPRVSQSPQNGETHDLPIEEKLIANITATHNEDGSPLTMPQWLILAALLI